MASCVAVVAATVLTRDIGYILDTPLWVDEAWVAVSVRLPLSMTDDVAVTTPMGWMLLLRGASALPGDPLRLVPLGFAVLAALAGWMAAREAHLRWHPTLAGLVGGMTVALSPALLTRADLKQYTADAFAALALSALAVRCARSRSRRDLAILVVASGACASVSVAGLFIAPSILGALLVDAAADQRWGDLRDRAIATLAAGAVLGAYAVVFVLPSVNSALTDYWADLYLPGAPVDAFEAIRHRFARVGPLVGGDAVWPLWYLAALFGAVRLWLIGQRVIVLTWVNLLMGLVLLGALERYPFLDIRTSTFVLVGISWFAGIGFLHGSLLIAQRSLRGALPLLVAGLATLGLVASAAWPSIWAHTVPPLDVRSQTEYVVEHRREDDVVLIGLLGGYGAAYYWTGAPVSVEFTDVTATGFITWPNDESVVHARDRTREAIGAAVREAVETARRRGADRIWIIHTHVGPTEWGAWKSELAAAGLELRDVDVGVEPLRYAEL